MIRIASLSIAGALLALGLSAAPAQAGPNRSWVSGHGRDSGACPLVAPCRTFAFALTQTEAGGEIDVLDPAGYGRVTITKAISIVNDGAGVATIGASSGNAITINAGAGDSVHLRGLTINGIGSGANGILFTTGGNLAIENCDIRNFTVAAINITPSTPSSFSVSNTIASDNVVGIDVAPSGSAVVKGVLGKVTTNRNSNGIFVDGTNTTGASLTITIDDSVSFVNNIGIQSDSVPGHAATTVYLAHSTVTGNSTGVFNSGGTIFTYGDNAINGNTVDDVEGTLTLVATR